MSEDACASCGRTGTRLDAPYTLDGQDFPDAYCGRCGANWGVRVLRIAEPNRKRTKPVLVFSDKDTMTRLGR